MLSNRLLTTAGRHSHLAVPFAAIIIVPVLLVPMPALSMPAIWIRHKEDRERALAAGYTPTSIKHSC